MSQAIDQLCIAPAGHISLTLNGTAGRKATTGRDEAPNSSESNGFLYIDKHRVDRGDLHIA
jgi:hypothetical protein